MQRKKECRKKLKRNLISILTLIASTTTRCTTMCISVL
jgi:hypothetical protein